MKKLSAILLIALALVCLSVTALADGDGSITVSNATIGQTYTLYKVFDATLDINNNPITISYTYACTLPDNPFFSQEGGAGGTIRITKAGQDVTGHLTSGAVEFLATLIGESSAVQTVVARSNTVAFRNLDYGYYYIGTTLDTLSRHAVSIDSTKPNTFIIDKNQGPTWYNPEGANKEDLSKNWLGKYIVLEDGTKVKANSVNFGDVVTFEVSFNATNYYGSEEVHTYFLNDTICDGFQIDQSSLQVFFDDAPQTLNTDYKVRWSTDGKKFTVSAPWHDAAGNLKFPSNANTVFKVTYNATLLTNAVIAGDGNPNTATFDYRKAVSDTPVDPSNPDAPPPFGSKYHDCPPETTVTYTYAVGITKIDGTDKHRLQGAEFNLFKGETAIKANQKTAGVYEYDIDGTVTQFTTNDSGELVIKGLEEGTYTLKEAKAPNGYNRTLAGKEFVFTRDQKDSYQQVHTVYFDKDGNPVIAETEGGKTVTTDYGVKVLGMIFENERGVALPITGGMGTTLFYVLGGALVFVAVLLLITKKRMHSEK